MSVSFVDERSHFKYYTRLWIYCVPLTLGRNILFRVFASFLLYQGGTLQQNVIYHKAVKTTLDLNTMGFTFHSEHFKKGNKINPEIKTNKQKKEITYYRFSVWPKAGRGVVSG